MAIGDYNRTTYVAGGSPPIDATNLNKTETKVKEIDTQLKYIVIDSSVLTYTSGTLTEVLEKVGGVNYQRSTLTYTSGNLTGINIKRYSTDGSTIIEQWNETLTYTSGALTSVGKVWV